MNSTEVAKSSRSAATRSSTSASTVASSAVVGSSRISSEGSAARAIATTTRCAIPPEIWCGYSPITRPGSEIWTVRSMASALSCAADRSSPATSYTSATWRPTRIDGFSALPGSWYTIDTVRARRARSASASMASGSWPLMLIRPPVTRPLRGRYLVSASATVDLPDPDSPTRPYDSRRPIWNETSRSARRSSPRTRWVTSRCSTCSVGVRSSTLPAAAVSVTVMTRAPAQSSR